MCCDTPPQGTGGTVSPIQVISDDEAKDAEREREEYNKNRNPLVQGKGTMVHNREYFGHPHGRRRSRHLQSPRPTRPIKIPQTAVVTSQASVTKQAAEMS